MSDDKFADDDPERTLITLNQLSQTIEVMTSVVNRLREHLSEQLKTQLAEQAEARAIADSSTNQIKVSEKTAAQSNAKRESFVVEINQQEADPERKSTKVLH